MTKRQGESTFEAYCKNLETLRYWHGKMNGYLSRLHYFTWWMHDNIDKGLIEHVKDAVHFTAPINVQNHYMSAHPDKYKFLKAHPEWVDSIKQLEQQYNGPDGFFLPANKTRLTPKELSSIHNGDIVAIVTRKDGIDYSHLALPISQRAPIINRNQTAKTEINITSVASAKQNTHHFFIWHFVCTLH